MTVDDPEEMLRRLLQPHQASVDADLERRQTAAERRLQARDERAARVAAAHDELLANPSLTDDERKLALDAAVEAAGADLAIEEQAIDDRLVQERAAESDSDQAQVVGRQAANRHREVATREKDELRRERASGAAKATVELEPVRGEPLTADGARAWWKASTNARPLPDESACLYLIGQIAICSAARGFKDLRTGPKPLTNARALLLKGYGAKIEARMRLDPRDEDNAFVVARLQEAVRALRNVGPDWLEDQRAVAITHEEVRTQEEIDTGFRRTDKELPMIITEYDLTERRWEVFVRFLYPKVARAWAEAGHKIAIPHATSPPIVFLAKALAYLGEGATPAAIRDWLRKALGHLGKDQTPDAIEVALRDRPHWRGRQRAGGRRRPAGTTG